jgi:hypothetical protein
MRSPLEAGSRLLAIWEITQLRSVEGTIASHRPLFKLRGLIRYTNNEHMVRP